MEKILNLFVLIPLTGFVLSLAIPRIKERLISGIAFVTVCVNLLLLLSFIVFWILSDFQSFHMRDISIYRDGDYNFFIDFYFDRVSAVYMFTGATLTFLITVYSRYYMHRESGFKRFFNTVLFFYLGYNITVLSGNFETLFIGWEILGISSFLLIAFYRGRYLPVKNAVRVFTIYRIGDVGILLAMWMSHHLWHENITFLKLNNADLIHDQLVSHSAVGIFISVMILIAAAAKSAQLPFSAWLPRAMEGPTPSSAIFYGSLSVHIGAFLLMRTFPFWEHQTIIRWLIAGLGFFTAVVTSIIARVQTTVKSQVAYSSAAQIGIIFIEIAAGLELLALIHFAGNAFLRTYQLLISPSVVTYMIREQVYHHVPRSVEKQTGRLARLKRRAYLRSLREWHLDKVVFTLFFRPLKSLRSVIRFLSLRNLIYFFVPVYLLGFYFAYIDPEVSLAFKNYVATGVALIALLFVAKAYNERLSSRFAWLLIVMAHFFVDLAITLNDHFDSKETVVYLSGIVVSGALGYFCLHKVKAFEHHGIGLHQYHGLVERYRLLGMLFLLSCLGLAGFPITTTFFGEDIILTHIHSDQFLLAFFVAVTFIVNGIAVIRIYARVFLGSVARNYQHKSDLTA